MRSTLIGIVIGVVVGVMLGATIVAPGLQKARQEPQNNALPGSETLPIPEAMPAQGTIPPPASDASRLRIVNLFPPKLPVLGEMAQRLEHGLAGASGGSINAQLVAPGTLTPASDTFNAVASGTIEAVFSSPGQWDPQAPALQLFTAVPFGPGSNELLAWFYHGGGRDIFDGLFKRRGVHAILCGAIPPEGSGWYLEPIRAPEDFTGLTIRAFGLGANVLEKMGATVVDMDAGKILAGFEKRTLNGAEYSLPAVDAEVGFQKFARNYYFPGWQQPVTLFTLAINQAVWDGLTPSGRLAIDQTCGDNVRFALTRADALQFEALKTLGLAGVQIRRWPEPVLKALEEAWKVTQRDFSKNDPDFAETWASLQKFRRDYAIWQELSRP
jgi:TRAP-type mannitol/chloroaromatic compound transport system substrate-binding protein